MSNYKDPQSDNPDFQRGRGYGRGHGRGRGRGPGRGRGRPPVAYPIDYDSSRRQKIGMIELSSFEFQILQMSDSEDLNQNEIAEKLDISQTSVWRYLKSVRSKIARAIAENNQIQIVISD